MAHDSQIVQASFPWEKDQELIYSPTKETHQSFLGGIMENRRNENIFIPYSLTISSASIH